jgi:hypothetical protein
MPKNFEDFNFLGELKDGVVIFKLPKLIQVSITNISVVNTDKAI